MKVFFNLVSTPNKTNTIEHEYAFLRIKTIIGLVRPSISGEVERELFKEVASIQGAFKGHIKTDVLNIIISMTWKLNARRGNVFFF